MVNQKKKDLRFLAIAVVVICIINLVSSNVFTRFDFTAEKRYTLSPVTRNILGGLDEKVQVTVYLEGAGFPAGFKRLRSSVFDILTDFKAYSNNKLEFDFVNPLSGDEQTQHETYRRLLEKGIEPTNLSVRTEEGMSQKIIFPAALITYKNMQMPVRLLQNRSGISPEEVLNNSVQNLEYALAGTIRKLSSGEQQRIGFTEGHGELSDLQLNDALRSLGDAYQVGRVDLSAITFGGLDKLRLLVIAKPEKEFTEAEKYKIDYFVMKGGRVLWAIDQVNAELDSLRAAGEQLSFPKKLNLDDMLFRYGVRINYDLLADMNSAQIPVTVGNIGGQPQIRLLPWLFYPVFVPVSAHPMVKNLDGIRSEFSSTIDLIDVKGIRGEVILASSPFSRKMEVPGMLSLQMVEQEPDPESFRGEPEPVAVLLEGEFPSVFRNRPVPAGITDDVSIPEKSRPGKMLVLADGDILRNQVNPADASPYPLGYDRYTEQQYANKSFLLNAADYLTDDSGIIDLRNKEVKLRLLDRVRIRQEKTMWQLINIGLPLIMLIVCGIFQHYYRIRKYTH